MTGTDDGTAEGMVEGAGAHMSEQLVNDVKLKHAARHVALGRGGGDCEGEADGEAVTDGSAEGSTSAAHCWLAGPMTSLEEARKAA